MKTVKVSDLSELVLNWLVARLEGYTPSVRIYDGAKPVNVYLDDFNTARFACDWSQGGPIIEREWLDVTPWPNETDEDLRWQCQQHDSIDCLFFGPTPLIAAMRCHIASELGDEVEVPEELL